MAKSDHLTDHQRMAWDKITHYDKTGEGEFWRNPDDNTLIAVKYGARFAGISTLRALAKAGLIELPNPKSAWFRVLIPPSLYDIGDPYPITPAPAAIAQTADGAGIDFGLQNKVDTLKYDLSIADEHIREQDAQIAALTSELASAKAEAAALRKEREAVKQAFDGYQSAALEKEAQMPKYRIGDTVAIGENGMRGIGTIEEIHISERGVEYSVYVDGESMAYTWREASLDRASADAAERAAADTGMVAALKAHDNGNRTSADNVLAMFADDDEGTIA